LRESAANLVILDVRTPEEYGRFCIPGGINVPGGDLILWAEELKHRPDATVIVNCAGRTRSIIGTAALRRLGLSHARALRNGTMGWVLVGMELETKPQRSTPSAPADSREKANSLARQIAAEEGIRWITTDATAALLGRADDGVSYFIDVRSESEFESGHLPQSLNVPGGQAVQRADDFVAVRNARIVFISSASARAVMAAYWYQQMGFPNVYVLQGGLRAWADSGAKLELGPLRDEPLGFEAAKQAARYVDAKAVLGKNHSASAFILDVGTSAEHEIAHVPGARWISRGWIDIKLPELFPDRTQAMLLTCADGQNSVFAALTLKDLGYVNVSVLNGGVRGWSAAGLDTEKGLEAQLVEPNDVVVSPSVRGNKEDMQRYLDWELKLHS
jgi:rhodanese-related sulfurtransferase